MGNYFKTNFKSYLSLSIMIIITCLTQVTTIAKSSIVAGIYGASLEMDAYNFANSMTSFVTGFVSAGMTTVIIPAYVNKVHLKSINTFITTIFSSLLLIICIFLAFRYKLVYLFSNRTEMFVNLACNLLLIMMLTQYITVIIGITDAFFQYEQRYNVPKIIALLSQILVLLALTFSISRNLNIYQYAIILSVGVIFNFAADLLVAYKSGFRFKPQFALKDTEFRKLLNIFWPTIFSSGVYRISLLTDTLLSSRLEVGKITILSYSNQIISMINSLFIGNLLIFIYPKIVIRIKEKKSQKYFWDYTMFFHIIICLLITVFFTVGKEGIAILFQRGKFTSVMTYQVYFGAAIYISGQQVNIIRDLIYRYFYSNGDTQTTVKNSILVSVVNICVSILLTMIIGFYGIIYGTVIAGVVSLLAIVHKFDRKFGIKVDKKYILIEYFKNNLCMVFTTVIILFIKSNYVVHNLLVSIICWGFLTVIIFVGILILLRGKSYKVEL